MDSTKHVEPNTAATATSSAEVTKNAYRSTKPSPVFHYFLKLPAEIRSQIYHEFAACDKSGSLNLFNTSKQMRNEGAEASARHYKFEFWLGWSGDILITAAELSRATLDSKATAVIQNVRLIIYLDGCGKDRPFMPLSLDCRLIGYLGGSQVMRESCLIVLSFGYKGYLSKDCASTTLFKTLRQLINFRSVTIDIEFYKNTRDHDHFPIIKNIRRVDLYAQRVEVALEPALGPAILVMQKHKSYPMLVFHPFGWKSRIDQLPDLA